MFLEKDGDDFLSSGGVEELKKSRTAFSAEGPEGLVIEFFLMDCRFVFGITGFALFFLG